MVSFPSKTLADLVARDGAASKQLARRQMLIAGAAAGAVAPFATALPLVARHSTRPW